MQRTLLLLLMVCIAGSLAGQVLINLQLPPTGMTLKSQLWNFSLINTGTDKVNVRVDVSVRDQAGNVQVFAGSSKSFELAKGMKQVQYQDVLPITYTIYNGNYGVDANPDGFLPIGNFQVCYSVFQYVSDATESVAEECQGIEVEPVSPPLLVLPADSERIILTRPLFTWTPPVPINRFSALNYDWTLVEVLPGQSGDLAVQQNLPLLTASSLSATNFQYPASSPELDSTKTYAWQITAKNNSNAVGKSEVWTFRIAKLSPDTTNYKQEGYYIRLAPQSEASYTICFGDVRYEYVNDINDSTAQVHIYDITLANHPEVTLDTAAQKLRFGQNFIKHSLAGMSGIINRHLYLLELRDSRNQSWYLKFEYRDPNQ